MYQLGRSEKSQLRRRIILLAAVLFLVVFITLTGRIIGDKLRPKVTIESAPAVTTKVTYSVNTKHYMQPDFGIDLPADWQAAPSPNGSHKQYRWQSKDGQLIEAYEDTIPTDLALKRVLVVEPKGDHLQLDGSVSDACSRFTKSPSSSSNQNGVPAKWLDIEFLCDLSNQQPEVIGTSSANGVNRVRLTKSASAASHTFFFTYSTAPPNNPNFDTFYSALKSFHLQ